MLSEVWGRTAGEEGPAERKRKRRTEAMWAAGSSGRHALVSKQLCSQGGVHSRSQRDYTFWQTRGGGRAVG